MRPTTIYFKDTENNGNLGDMPPFIYFIYPAAYVNI